MTYTQKMVLIFYNIRVVISTEYVVCRYISIASMVYMLIMR